MGKKAKQRQKKKEAPAKRQREAQLLRAKFGDLFSTKQPPADGKGRPRSKSAGASGSKKDQDPHQDPALQTVVEEWTLRFPSDRGPIMSCA